MVLEDRKQFDIVDIPSVTPPVTSCLSTLKKLLLMTDKLCFCDRPMSTVIVAQATHQARVQAPSRIRLPAPYVSRLGTVSADPAYRL